MTNSILKKNPQEEIDYFNRLTSTKEIETINSLPKQKVPCLDGFTGKFCNTKHLMKKLYQFSVISFTGQKQTHVTTLIPNQTDIIRKETNISYE